WQDPVRLLEPAGPDESAAGGAGLGEATGGGGRGAARGRGGGGGGILGGGPGGGAPPPPPRGGWLSGSWVWEHEGGRRPGHRRGKKAATGRGSRSRRSAAPSSTC